MSQALQYLKAAGPGQQVYPGAPETTHRRCYTCTRADTLRTVMETLALPSVSRLARGPPERLTAPHGHMILLCSDSGSPCLSVACHAPCTVLCSCAKGLAAKGDLLLIPPFPLSSLVQICVQAGTQRIEGLITLSDIATFLFC